MINLVDNSKKLDFDDVLIAPEFTSLSSRSEVSLIKDIECIHSKRIITGIPIISANMDKVSTVAAANALGDHNCFSALHKFVSDEDLKEIKHKDKTFLTFGITDLEKIDKKLTIAGIEEDKELLCLDVANGGMEVFLDFIKKVREEYPKAFIIAGNCANKYVAQRIVGLGASLVKVGIGSGQHCKTRMMTGVGYPQMSCVSECSDMLKSTTGSSKVISDGGCKTVSDIVKAFVVGAEMVMIGSMFAGHKENIEEFYENTIEGSLTSSAHFNWDNPCELITVPMRGMSSKSAMEDHYGSMASYRASEGHETMIAYRGAISNTINEILGGIRSACTYTNSHTISDLVGSFMMKIK